MIKKYNLQPVKGQALLNYRDRLLPGSDISMSLYEIEIIEEVRQNKTLLDGNNDFQNMLINGDCLSACAYLKSKNIKVDLVYIDPPFASGANYAKKIYLRNNDGLDINKNSRDKGNDNLIGEEIMYGDIWQKEDYLNWLYERILAIKEIINDNGSIMLHLDWHIGHYAKVMLDEIFGEENFINEIIWSYRTGGASQESGLPKKHDIILFYSKNPDFKINPIKERQYLEKSFMDSKQDENGNFYSDTLLRDVLEGIINKVLDNGKIKEYNVRPVLNLSGEQRFYSTQKPIGLLELLIDIATDEGMIVADFFSGSGTTSIASNNLKRNFIACDIGINAIQTTRDGLKEAGASFDILKIKDGLRLFRNPTQTLNMLTTLIPGFKTAKELEFGSIWFGGIPSKKGNYIPVYFSGITNTLSKQEIDMVITEIVSSLETTDETESMILYAYKENDDLEKYIAKELKLKASNVKITLKSLDELLGEKKDSLFAQNEAIFEVKDSKLEIVKYFSPYLHKKIEQFNEKKTKKETSKKVEISKEGLELIENIQIDWTLKKDGIWTANIEDKAKIKSKVKGVYEIQKGIKNIKVKIRNIAGDEDIFEVNV